MTIEPNQLIDNRYRVIEHLGQGGMGTVWKALDQQLNDEVVIKMPLVNSEPALLQRFATEARMMRKHSIGNPNIIDIQGVGTVDETPYYVMRFLPGGSLEDRFPLVDSADATEFKIETFEWLLSIGKALDYLHDSGVMHRDVKPANILFNKSGDAYLADFGIAKNPTEASSFTQYSTATGTSPGTFGYMAPEVLYPESENPISGTADQYALAVTLHESIAGKRPYDSTNVIKLYQQTQEGCLPLRESFSHLPETASQAVVRALSADASQRFGNCREFADVFLDGLRNKAGFVVTSPPIKTEAKMDDEGTREFDREKYRQELEKQKEASGRSDGPLFPERPTGPVQPMKPAGPTNSGSKGLLIGFGALLLAGLLLGGSYFSGVFNGLTQSPTVMNNSYEPAAGTAEGSSEEVGLDEQGLIPPANLIPPASDTANQLANSAMKIEAVEKVVFETQIKPIFTKYCLECHSEEGEAFRINDSSEMLRYVNQGSPETSDIYKYMTLDEDDDEVMPPADHGPRPKAEEIRLIKTWIDQGARTVSLSVPFGQSDIDDELERLDRDEGLKSEVTNSIGMKFLLIPAGEFTMGSPDSETSREDREVQHRVEISRPFYMGKHEVTQSEWKSVMGTEPWTWEGGVMDGVKEGADYPATYVGWKKAMSFCKKLSSRDGVEYRLPSEAQWEYACRAGTDSAYSFGDKSGDLGEYAWFSGNAFNVGEKYAHEVGQKRANGFGLHDMPGNVDEWCHDIYRTDYFQNSPRRDPSGPTAGGYQVIRGGKWDYSAPYCRSAYRKGNTPDHEDRALGFRVLRSSTK